MRIVTPSEVAIQTGNKYLGVLVAAKFARFVNDFPRDRSVDLEKKLTTRAMEELVAARLKYPLLRPRPPVAPPHLSARPPASASPAGTPAVPTSTPPRAP